MVTSPGVRAGFRPDKFVTAFGGAPSLVTPSWVMSGASLDLDFVNNRGFSVGGGPRQGTVANFLSTTRASTKYVRDVAGNLTLVGSGLPAITDMGLSVEESRANIILRSAEFDNAAWTKTDTTVTANNIAAPDGSSGADLLTEGTAGDAGIVQGVTATANVNYAVSRFVKFGNAAPLKFWLGQGGNQFMAWFNVQTGVVGTTAAAGTGAVVSATIEPFVNGWYLCKLVGSVGSGSTAIDFHTFSTAADASDTRVNNATRYEWGAQFENNAAFVTSYVPTAGSTATRAADVVTMAAGPWFNEAAGTVYWEGSSHSPAAANANLVQFDDGSAVNVVGMAAHRTDEAAIFRVRANNANAFNTAFGTLVDGVSRKVAVAYSSGGNAAVINGGTVTSNATTYSLTAAITTLRIGVNQANTEQANGFVRRLSYKPVVDPTALMQALTVP